MSVEDAAVDAEALRPCRPGASADWSPTRWLRRGGESAPPPVGYPSG
ncbi:hypothetical protein ACFVDH_39500 [Streptomyces sp. NPDC057674]